MLSKETLAEETDARIDMHVAAEQQSDVSRESFTT